MKTKLWARLNAFPFVALIKGVHVHVKNSQAKVGGALPYLRKSWGARAPAAPLPASHASGPCSLQTPKPASCEFQIKSFISS